MKWLGRSIAALVVVSTAILVRIGCSESQTGRSTGTGQETRQPSSPQQEAAQSLPGDLVAAWVNAGAEVGWMETNLSAMPTFRTGGEGKKGEVPAFRFSEWMDGVVSKLPPPQQAFGLHLEGTKLTDAGLKEVARLKNLHTLSLNFTNITDAGLEELAGLSGLRTLDIGFTEVTDVGLLQVARLQGLQSLNLARAKLSFLGLSQLPALKSLRFLNLDATRVDDLALRELAALNGLESLELS